MHCLFALPFRFFFLLIIENPYLFKFLFHTIILAVLISSCDNKGERLGRGEPVARVNEELLYIDNIRKIVPIGTSADDSLEIINGYIDNWLRETLVIQKAEENLTDDQKNVEAQLLNYRNSLITYTYEKELVKQRLDTLVTNAEIENYYNNNKANFELKDNIIKVI